MMRSMFAGVSGLRSHQMMMDVGGDNIANINTPGYKASRVVFQNTLAQVIRGGAAGSQGQGGVNPQQVGLGVRVAGIDMINTQGPIQNTGRTTDVAIQGEGYFVVRAGAEQVFTRGGSFNFDNLGNLTDPTGSVVQGWLADQKTGALTTTGPSSDIKLPLGQSIAPQSTTKVTLGGNLSSQATTYVAPPEPPATTPAGDTTSLSSTAIAVVDSLGATHRVSFEYKKSGDNSWSLQVMGDDGEPLANTPAIALTFDGKTGALTAPAAGPQITLPGKDGADATTFSLDFGKPGEANALTQFGGASTAAALDQDGAPTGYLRSFAIADDGTVSGVFSNGRSKVLAQLALAGFTNPAGLVKAGNGHFRAAAGSGNPMIGMPGGQGRGSLAAGALEMSNVELSQEFTNLMIAQRGFQANSRIISSSDEMLQELVNLKR